MKKYSDLVNDKNYFITAMFMKDNQLEEEAEYQSMFDIPQEPTQEDRIEAQVLYTALMTDTLLEG